MRGVTQLSFRDPRLDRHVRDLDVTGIEDAALSECRRHGAGYAAVRVHQTRSRYVHLRDLDLETATEHREIGVGVRVLVDGAWGFAATSRLDRAAVTDAARRACALAARCAHLPGPDVVLADEPTASGTHISEYEIDPFSVPMDQMVSLLRDGCRILAPGVDHTSATVETVLETTYLVDLAGSRIWQQRVRTHPVYTAIRITDGGFDDMSTTAPPSGRGWEYASSAWDWDEELAQMPGLLDEKLGAPSITAGRYDLVIDPTNLWLTIHESVGHATEKDRALGYEANYAGTSFATPDLLGTLRYGSELMNVRADRTTAHGLSTVGWDDEAVAAQQWDLVRDGVLVGYQLDRQMAGEGQRSNGCAYADSAEHVPIQRMPNVSLQPAADGPATEDLIAGVEDGIYIVGDKSWSIDMQRFNFQFTGQRFHRIRHGRLTGQVKDVAYQANTLAFWGALTALGGPQTYMLGGALNCGKGQPGQVAAVSHGCPSAVFGGVNVLNTREEARP
jgi:TldD protein